MSDKLTWVAARNAEGTTAMSVIDGGLHTGDGGRSWLISRTRLLGY